MRRLVNANIRTKFIVSFALVLGCTIGLGVFKRVANSRSPEASTDAASGMVTAGADEVARDVDTMRAEVTRFMKAMASNDDGDRGRYERISGNGAQAVLHPHGG
jgi:hypothetical protein